MDSAPETPNTDDSRSRVRGAARSPSQSAAVVVRVRPWVSEDSLARSGAPASVVHKPCVAVTGPCSLTVARCVFNGPLCCGLPRSPFLDQRTYTVDAVLGPESEQERCFDVVARPLIDDVLQGVHGTVLCYGQVRDN
jgi:hypothetical protein